MLNGHRCKRALFASFITTNFTCECGWKSDYLIPARAAEEYAKHILAVHDLGGNEQLQRRIDDILKNQVYGGYLEAQREIREAFGAPHD